MGHALRRGRSRPHVDLARADRLPRAGYARAHRGDRAGTGERRTSIGYRAAWVPPALGRHGLLKTEIAERVSQAAAGRGLSIDIATGAAATIRGDDWYRFLADCKYTLGVEGGASVHDPDGDLQDATIRYLADHPGASFEEVEANCFPGADGGIAYFALSPRHLEACATRTAQVLVEGSYNGILRPGEHYIELRRDFSNLDEVLDLIESDGDRDRLTEAAYREVVASGEYTYERLVRDVEAVALADAPARRPSPVLDLLNRWASATDAVSWIKVAVWVQTAGRLRAFALRRLPAPDARVHSPPHRRHRRRDRGAAVSRITRRAPHPVPGSSYRQIASSGTRRNLRHLGPTRRAMITRPKMFR